MIKKIYSKKDSSLLLNILYINSLSDGKDKKDSLSSVKRHELTDQDHFLQAMLVEMPKESHVKSHNHNVNEKKTKKTHEAFVILKGSLELSIYDVDNTLIEKLILSDGDCSVLINGGHSLKTLTKTSLFEFKNGPYLGADNERTYFD